MGYLKEKAFVCCILVSVIYGISFSQIPFSENENLEKLCCARLPLPIESEKTAVHRWLNKPVLESVLLDSMEDPNTWMHRGYGSMTFTQQRAVDQRQSLRLTCPTYIGRAGLKPQDDTGLSYKQKGRPAGAAVARRNFDGEDWTGYNRISFWVYPTLPGFRTISLSTLFYNDGELKSPRMGERDGHCYFVLKGDQWNHIVWEIAHLPRDKVMAIEFEYRLQGNERGATEVVCYDIDKLELQRVEADYFEGWAVAPGRIAYSHTGYLSDFSKVAFASGIGDGSFELLDADTGQVVLSRDIRTVETHLGRFQIMDFSEVLREGKYVLKVGDLHTQPFRIGNDVWRGTIWKIINFFYCERCGFAVPGIHDICHSDWRTKHNGKQIIINGGWHDAGDLSQSSVNTSDAVYGMLVLAETLMERDRVLAERLIEEARWGLDWLLKTRFGDGFRSVWATMDLWTDGIIGTEDDIVFTASNGSFANYCGALAEAAGARLLKKTDPVKARYALNAACEDWQDASAKAGEVHVQLAATAALASLELYSATGDGQYADKAIECGQAIMASQQDAFMQWKVPLAGFFYTGSEKKQILHYTHGSFEHLPVVVLARLCDMFPEHDDWIRWYAAVVLYSEYLSTIAAYTEPYFMLPNGIYHIDGTDKPNYRQEVIEGIKLGNGYYLRLFPVWAENRDDFRGNNGTILAQAKALAAAGRLRRNDRLLDLCQKQLQWVVGRNPFVQSTMYGQGYDYPPQFTATSGDIVGSIAVGIETLYNRDIPYWPAENCYNYKEVWVHPCLRWLWILSDLYCRDSEQLVGFDVSGQSTKQGQVTITINFQTGDVKEFDLKTWNLDIQQHIEIKVGQESKTVTLEGKMQSLDKPWVAVVIPNNNMPQRKEVFGYVSK